MDFPQSRASKETLINKRNDAQLLDIDEWEVVADVILVILSKMESIKDNVLMRLSKNFKTTCLTHKFKLSS